MPIAPCLGLTARYDHCSHFMDGKGEARLQPNSPPSEGPEAGFKPTFSQYLPVSRRGWKALGGSRKGKVAPACSWSQQVLLGAPFPERWSLRPGSLLPDVSQDRQGLRQGLRQDLQGPPGGQMPEQARVRGDTRMAVVRGLSGGGGHLTGTSPLSLYPLCVFSMWALTKGSPCFFLAQDRAESTERHAACLTGWENVSMRRWLGSMSRARLFRGAPQSSAVCPALLSVLSTAIYANT